MKKLSSIIVSIMLTLIVVGQSPEKISYQAVLRDTQGNLLSNTQVSIMFSILHGSESGEEIYQEIHHAETSASGLVSLALGTGLTADDFSAIPWNNGPFFMRTELDTEGGNEYVVLGVQQLLSVPYALHANSADELTAGVQEDDPVFASSVAYGITPEDTSSWNRKVDKEIDGSITNELQNLSSVLVIGNDAGGRIVSNLGEPESAQDAVTKAYVDQFESRITALEEHIIKYGVVSDIDSNFYRTVKIGEQRWMAENLRTTRDNTGEKVGFFYPDLDTNTFEEYGLLYSANVANVCPCGWHNATDHDWKVLEAYLGIDTSWANVAEYRGKDEAKALKIGGATGFNLIYTGEAGSGSMEFFHDGIGKFVSYVSSNEVIILNGGPVYPKRVFSVGENRFYRCGHSPTSRYPPLYPVRCVMDN